MNSDEGQLAAGEWDVIVVGGGAAGLMASTAAAERGLRSLVLEKNRKVGVKILISGGTRCNITHDCSAAEIAKEFPTGQKFLRAALGALTPQMMIDLIELWGVPTVLEPNTGKIFPASDRAIDVRDALYRRSLAAGVQWRTGCPVIGVERIATGFRCLTDLQSFDCRSLILTTGGKSYSGCGTNGDGYVWAESLGHTVTLTRPALTPVVIHLPWLNALQGIALDRVEIAIQESATGIELGRSNAPVLFTHFGLSGPGPMNLSRWISETEPQATQFIIDYVPWWNAEQLRDHLTQQKQVAATRTVGLLGVDELPRRLVESLWQAIELPIDLKWADVSKKQLAQMAEALKKLPVPIHGTRGYPKAEVTSGGVALDEVDHRTMESKLIPGLYFAGEILDLDGPIGGYNFQSAFSTGDLAGRNAG